MKTMLAAMLCLTFTACQEADSSEPAPKGQVVQGLYTGDAMVVYFSDGALSQSERAAIDANEKISRPWTRVEYPASADVDVEIDLSVPGDAKFSQEYSTRDPATNEPTTYRVDFSAGTEGLSGSFGQTGVTSENPDDVGLVRVSYKVVFQGLTTFMGETPSRLDFESYNDALLVPEESL